MEQTAPDAALRLDGARTGDALTAEKLFNSIGSPGVHFKNSTGKEGNILYDGRTCLNSGLTPSPITRHRLGLTEKTGPERF